MRFALRPSKNKTNKYIMVLSLIISVVQCLLLLVIAFYLFEISNTAKAHAARYAENNRPS